jgi:hypothetical protein
LKYTLLELLFSNHWQWVRRMSGQVWCYDSLEVRQWVKFSDEEIERMKRIGVDVLSLGTNSEDWRRK